MKKFLKKAFVVIAAFLSVFIGLIVLLISFILTYPKFFMFETNKRLEKQATDLSPHKICYTPSYSILHGPNGYYAGTGEGEILLYYNWFPQALMTDDGMYYSITVNKAGQPIHMKILSREEGERMMHANPTRCRQLSEEN